MRLHIVVAVISLLAGCASEVGVGPGDASFGAAERNNVIVQSAPLRGDGALGSARVQFAAEAHDTLTFDFDSAILDPDARAALAEQATWLSEHPAALVRITGHADLVGGESYNNRIGMQRARAAAARLIALGVARDRIEAIESDGERRPTVATAERERRNRRALTEVVGLSGKFTGDGLDGPRARLIYTRYSTDTVETPASANTTSVNTDGG